MITRFSTVPAAWLLAAAAFCCCAASAFAQRMPQDSWRYSEVQFASPTNNVLRSIAIGSGGVYVGEVSSGNTTKVIQFTEGGTFVRRFTATFTHLVGLACDPAGNVYVLDRGDSKVKVFDPSGTFIRDWGGSGSGNGQFNLSGTGGFAMITVDKSSRVYVCDPGNNRVQVFDSTGTFIRKWGQLGSLADQFPAGNPISVAWSPKGEVCVGTNAGSWYLRIFAEDGTFKRSGSANYSSYPLAITPDGLFLSENSNGQLYAYDSAFAPLANFADVSFRTDGGFAVSKKGSLYAVSGDTTHIRIHQREYTSVQNSALPPAIPQPIVLSAAQRTGTSWMDIDYQVTDADSPTVTTGALAFKDGGNTLADAVVMSTFMEGTSANIGASQPVDVSRHLTWNMAADWSVNFAQVQVEALAKDSRNLLGVHWITVPASGPDPAFQVSSAPITDAQLLDLWYWFLGTRQAGIGLANGVVTGTAGLYSGTPLASGVSTTSTGRIFTYEQMGARAINGNELARALAGNYGFSSVNGNSIVNTAAQVSSYLRAWGDNSYGQGTIQFTSTGAVKAAAGGNHSLFVKTDGTLWAVGYNVWGQLGDGTTTNRGTPVQVATAVSQVVSGGDPNYGSHSLFVKTDGTLWAMGYNGYGQLGDGTTTQRTTPVQVATGVSQIAAAGDHSLFVKTDGTLWAMGYNAWGQLGDGTTTQRTTPVQVATGVSQIAAGGDGSIGSHSLFVKTGGTMWAMGYNNYGQLGDGTTTQRSTPVQVATGVSKVAVAGGHSLFVKIDGTLLAMGYNGWGQLGDGTTTSRSTPVQVGTGVSLVAAGGNTSYGSHSIFVKTGGTLWAMGYNGYGQLGDGTTTSRSTPVQIGENITALAAGARNSVAVVTAP